MATIQPQFDRDRDGTVVVLWETVTNADTCAPITTGKYLHALTSSLEIAGTPDSATVDFKGSSDDSQYGSIKDVTGTTIALSSAGDRVEVSTAAPYLKPTLSGGGGSQDLDIRLTMVI